MPIQKFHLIAVPAALVLLALIYTLGSGSDTPPSGNASSGQTLQIATATWGENCNLAIEQTREKTGIQQKNIISNNALQAVSALCNGRTECTVAAAASVLKFNPIDTKILCRKELSVSYHCDAFKPPMRFVILDGDAKTIACK